jgi:hypothetical protein
MRAALLVVCDYMTKRSIARNVSVTYLTCQVATEKLVQFSFDITCLDHFTGVAEARYCLRVGSFCQTLKWQLNLMAPD